MVHAIQSALLVIGIPVVMILSFSASVVGLKNISNSRSPAVLVVSK